MNIPFLNFDKRNLEIKAEIMDSFEEFFDSNRYVLGPKLLSFEEEYASFSGTDFCVGVSNGLDALKLSLKVLNIGEGDEVIVPSNTYIATVLAVTAVGAIPIFVEPDVSTFNIDPSKITEAITSKTKCIIPVHLYGQPCKMDEIMDIASENKLFVVEDNAQSQGATYDGKRTGSFGDVNAVSFYPGKNIGALGEAGAITMNNKAHFEKVKVLRNYGSSQKYINTLIGYNNRMDEVQASFVSVMLRYIDSWNDQRNQIAKKYELNLKHIENLILPEIQNNAYSVWHQYVIRTDRRDELQDYLKNNGIGTLIHYPIPPHMQECYKELGYNKGNFPIAEKMANTVLSLPIYPGLSDIEIKYITDSIDRFYK
jgi:dTDP-4-amino-4,6-dideoxygalactose transaminase